MSWLKYKTHLDHKTDNAYQQKLRQIDAKNLKLFIRLSSVQPKVPIVVRRNGPSNFNMPSITAPFIDTTSNKEQGISSERPYDVKASNNKITQFANHENYITGEEFVMSNRQKKSLTSQETMNEDFASR